MKAVRTWILVADGAHARVVVNNSPGDAIEQIEAFDFESENLASREIDADRPGRTFNRVGGSSHAMEPPQDAHDNKEREFLLSLGSFLHQHQQRGSYDRLIVAAAPKALGILRATMSAAVKDKISGELAKDLTHIPTHELAPHFSDLLN